MARSPSLGLDGADDPGGLCAALTASGVVGVWCHDIWADRLALSAPLARLLGLVPEAGRRGRPLADLIAATHGDDRATVKPAGGQADTQGNLRLPYRYPNIPRPLSVPRNTP